MISILLVDDEPGLLDIARSYVEEQRGFRIECLPSAKAALLRMQETEFDVIVADYQIPEMNGIEFLKKIRGKKIFIPFIIFTGGVKEDIAIEALNAGADFYLQKVGDPKTQLAELFNIIKKVVRQHRAEEALEVSEERYRRITEGLTDYLYTVSVHNGQAVGTKHGAACLTVTGYTADEFAADSYLWLRMIHPDDRNRVISHFSGVLSGNPVPPVEHRIVRKDGQVRWVRDTPVLQFDTSGNLISYDGVIKDITERKAAEEILLHLSEFQESVISNARVWLSVLDPKGKILIWNAAAEEISGYRSNEVIGQNGIWKLLYPKKEYRTQVTDTITRIIRDRKYLENFETTIRSRDGSEKIISWNTKGIADATGLITNYIAIGLDVTDRKLAEDALRVHAEIERNMSDAVYLIRVSDGVIVYTNPIFERLFGYDSGELVGRHVSVINAPVDKGPKEVADEIITSLMRTGAWSGELLSIRKDRTTFWSHANVITFEHPRFGQVWLSMHQDITKRKVAEEALVESESRYREFFTISRDSVFITSPMGRWIDFNDALVEMLGYENRKEMSAVSVPAIYAHTNERSAFIQLIEREGFVKEYPIQLKKKDETVIDTIITTVPVRNPDGSLKAFTGTIRDVTERKRAEEALASANKKLNLLSSITRHDINNQLSVLVGYLRILEKKQPDNSFNEYFLKVSTSAERISAMIQFTKTYESIGVNAAVWQDCRTLADTAAKQAPLGQVMVKNDLPAGTEVFSDSLIVKVFYNLMDNAARYGGKITMIHFSFEEREGNKIIVCEDDGVGVPVEEKEKIFERGFGKNTGLGLALAREILDITGITIRETGEPGKGARFEMTVPKGAWRITQRAD
jgi:PAS domain S-box-containing protein